MPDQTPEQARTKLSLQVGAVVFGRTLVSILDAIRAFALARLLTKGDFGTLSFALAWFGTATGLGGLGIADSLLALLPRATPGGQRQLVQQSVRLLAGVGTAIAVALLAVAWAPGLLPPGRPELPWCVTAIACAVAFDLPGSVLQSFLLGVSRHRQSALVATGLSLLANLAMLLPAALGAPIALIAASVAIVGAARLLITLGFVRHVFAGIAAEPQMGGLRAQLAYAVPLSLNGAAGLVNRYFATYAAGLVLTAEAFASFAASAQELPFVSMIPYAVAVAVLPRLTEIAHAPGDPLQQARNAVALWHTSMLKVALVMLPLFAVLLFGASDWMAALYGPSFRDGALAFGIAIAVLPLRLTSYGTMLLALGRPRAILNAQLVAIAVNSLGMVGLWWATHVAALPLGPVGRMAWAATAATVATWVSIVAMVASVAAAAQLRFWHAFPWQGWLLRLAAAGVAALPALGLAWWLPALDTPTTLLRLVLQVAVYAPTYLGVALGFGLLGPDDRRVVVQWLRLEPLWRK